jgi:hypothetical protein
MTTIRLRALVATSMLCLALLVPACDGDDGGSSGAGGSGGAASGQGGASGGSAAGTTGRGGTTAGAGTTGNAGTFGGGRGGSGGATASAGRGGGTGGVVWDGGLPDGFNLDAALADAGIPACGQGVAMGGTCTPGTETACRPAANATLCVCQNAGTWRCF